MRAEIGASSHRLRHKVACLVCVAMLATLAVSVSSLAFAAQPSTPGQMAKDGTMWDAPKANLQPMTIMSSPIPVVGNSDSAASSLWKVSAAAMVVVAAWTSRRSQEREARRTESSRSAFAGFTVLGGKERDIGTLARQARGGGVGPGSLVVIAGPPAAGKGTLCEEMKKKYGFVHISTGDILRENVKNETELGLKAKEYMDKGALVPSELIVGLVEDRLGKDDIKEKGCLLDGFPRAPDQAEALVKAGLKVDKFVLLEVPDDTLVDRGVGRRLDPETGEIYHLKNKPPPPEIMDRLVHRSDDQEEKIRNRLKQFHDQIDGIVPFFKDVLVEIDGTGTPSEVWELTQKQLD